MLGVLPGVIGTIQATEALKLILGIGEPLVGRLLVYDALKMRFRELKLPKDPDCPICGDRPTITDVARDRRVLRRGDAGAAKATVAEMTVRELKARIDAGRAPLILDVREPFEAAICSLPGARFDPARRAAAAPRRARSQPPRSSSSASPDGGARSAVGMLRESGFTGRST